MESHIVVIIGVTVLLLALWIYAATTIFSSRGLTTGGKTAWALFSFVLPVIGPLAWLLYGKAAADRSAADWTGPRT
ncbi:PLD nuclease N-terminal domain-containing protein [Frigoribacterium sp. PhB24]|uniref:PLD nuclease N-terminal domain-containing protein n=1 Tax=Frigoribacterium sp. PhB24 TaxID=2485204 RepID=UPI000F49AF48|nr:PLD nuclease N-terminal domain-containing protein [Frigoribacterium sp. PhB24]ROS49019.1 phospholipase D-like protein [Frigoribacterium sp. PhB24]